MNLGRKSQQPKAKLPIQETAGVSNSWLTLPKQPQDSCRRVPRSSPVESSAPRDQSKQPVRCSIGKDDPGDEEREIQFSLSLTPEAILVIQKRSLEKQTLAKQQKCCASVDLRHRRVFPSKRTQGGVSKSTVPAEHAEDITAIVKISLLNDRYKYDDVEYEEEDGDVDETVVRKCKEWLRGVESAAALGKVDKISTLPHLKS
ncbi:hypothetical protein DPEC_G00326380 [Dallia pectoralis]|uniref:Uncharacterized protein n=1 Tax=Dallia pectoralis TaxID=75939 RepID=A0ACC2F7S3_DALPE|nr:hypothetical protein DPEC_G00326380 [Dallia pectoralis]